jgi:hypothetical protein
MRSVNAVFDVAASADAVCLSPSFSRLVSQWMEIGFERSTSEQELRLESATTFE